MAVKKAASTEQRISIKPPNFQTARFIIEGTSPFVQNKFSQKAMEEMRANHVAGSTSRKNTKKEPKDFQALYEGAKHKSEQGWIGIPAPAFRNAMISACRTVGFKMTLAKLGVFVDADGFDAHDKTPLIKMTGEPEYFETLVRLADGSPDIRPRPMWKPGWKAEIRIKFDADMFTVTDIANLLMRVGQQVGIGEGRPDSKKSAGMGWGMFKIAEEPKEGGKKK